MNLVKPLYIKVHYVMQYFWELNAHSWLFSKTTIFLSLENLAKGMPCVLYFETRKNLLLDI